MFFNLTDISLHERFSMRSELGMVFFCLLYNFHICVPRGSIFAISSGLSRSAPPVSSLQLGKTAFCRTSFCAFCFSGERSRLTLGDWYVVSDGGCWFGCDPTTDDRIVCGMDGGASTSKVQDAKSLV